MKLLFLHGWNSVPGGVKPTYLQEHGHEVVNPALPHEDMAEAVTFLCSPEAEMIRGQTLIVDGGFSLRA